MIKFQKLQATLSTLRLTRLTNELVNVNANLYQLNKQKDQYLNRKTQIVKTIQVDRLKSELRNIDDQITKIVKKQTTLKERKKVLEDGVKYEKKLIFTTKFCKIVF
jgi:predicted transcriptional regulator